MYAMLAGSAKRAFIFLLMGLAAGVWAGDIVVGQVVSFTHNGGDIGEGLKAGEELYFSHINATGGINGQHIRLVTRDDQYIPEETVKQTQDLIEKEHPVALIGFRGTANGLALIKAGTLAANQIPLVGTFSGAKELRKEPYMYHVRTTFDDELEGLAKIAKNLGNTKIAAFYQDDAFGRSGLNGLEVAAAKHDLNIIVKVNYDKTPERAEATLKEAARRVLEAKPEAVVLIGVADQTYSFVKKLREGGYSSTIYSLSVINPDRAVELIGKDQARGLTMSQVFPFPYSDTVPLVREYLNLRKKFAPNMPISYFSMEGFVNAKVLVEGLKRAGAQPSSKRVNEALRNLGKLDLGGFVIEFTPENHQGSRFTDLTVLNAAGVLQR